jgi:uncharacterized Zn finger protein
MSRIRKPQPQHFNPPKTCGGKHCYQTRHDAELVVLEKEILQPELKLAMYHCHSCGTYHLTRIKHEP